MDPKPPVEPHIVANLLMAAAQLLNERHDHFAVELLIKAEDLVQRVADPVAYLSLMRQADALWRSQYIRTELKPRGMVAQLDLPFGKGEN